MTRASYAAGGLVLGAALAALGLWLAPDAEPVDTVAATTTTTIGIETVSDYRIDPHETLLSSAVVIPESLFVEGGEAVLNYRVESLAPPSSGFLVEGQDPTGVSPETWTIETLDGDFTGTAANFDTRTVRFPIDDNFLIGRVTGLRIDQYRIRAPYHYLVELPAEEGASITLDDGRVLSIARLIPQTTSLIVHLDFESPLDPFDDPPSSLNFGFANVDTGGVTITGAGAEWISNSVRQFEGFQLIRAGDEVPDPLVLRVSSNYSVAISGPVPVDIGGLPLG
jgi:hypothetical protein